MEGTKRLSRDTWRRDRLGVGIGVATAVGIVPVPFDHESERDPDADSESDYLPVSSSRQPQGLQTPAHSSSFSPVLDFVAAA